VGGIIQTIAVFMMGIATGFGWRHRISQARRARERARQGRQKWQAEEGEMRHVTSIKSPSFRLH
jgi:hypothetical protein